MSVQEVVEVREKDERRKKRVVFVDPEPMVNDGTSSRWKCVPGE